MQRRQASTKKTIKKEIGFSSGQKYKKEGSLLAKTLLSLAKYFYFTPVLF
jgi:hypothetical protein